MKVKNVSSLGDLEVPALGGRVVKAGEVVEVPDDLGVRLLEQPDNWTPGKETKE